MLIFFLSEVYSIFSFPKSPWHNESWVCYHGEKHNTPEALTPNSRSPFNQYYKESTRKTKSLPMCEENSLEEWNNDACYNIDENVLCEKKTVTSIAWFH